MSRTWGKGLKFELCSPAMAEARKVAIVTGGAKRVGRAIVERLAEDGFDGLFTYHSSEAEAEDLRGTLARRRSRFVPVQVDLTAGKDAVDVIASAFEKSFSRLDVLVNNASLYEPDGLEDVTIEQCRRFWAIHVESPMFLCQRLSALLRASGGRVINMLDLLGERPWPKYLSYSASKAGLWNLTMSLARELAPEVAVNGIAPGVVDWPDDYPDTSQAQYLKRVPLGACRYARWMSPRLSASSADRVT